jgi:glutamate synthase domain-containing protein 3
MKYQNYMVKRGLPDDTLKLNFKGAAGQSFGAV